MKALIKTQVQNGRDYRHSKELVDVYSVVGKIDGNLREVVTVRCWMGRSVRASIVYASIWVRGKDTHTAGRGEAGGHGYHKPSAAIQEAITSAGIGLYGDVHERTPPSGTMAELKAYRLAHEKRRADIAGAGDSAIEAALKAIAKAAGATGELLVVHH